VGWQQDTDQCSRFSCHAVPHSFVCTTLCSLQTASISRHPAVALPAAGAVSLQCCCCSQQHSFRSTLDPCQLTYSATHLSPTYFAGMFKQHSSTQFQDSNRCTLSTRVNLQPGKHSAPQDGQLLPSHDAHASWPPSLVFGVLKLVGGGGQGQGDAAGSARCCARQVARHPRPRQALVVGVAAVGCTCLGRALCDSLQGRQ